MVKNKRLAGLSLIGDGSVGRLLAFDIDYVYLVTTTLSLMATHPVEYAAEALCFMVLDRDLHRDAVSHPYSIQRTRLKPVMSKIVKSIAYNVANCGHSMSTLPPRLKDLCQHTLSASNLAAVVMTIVRNSGKDILIYSGCFHVDLYQWLLNHYTGLLEISVEGEILVTSKLGTSRPDEISRVGLLIREGCKVAFHGRNSVQVTLKMTGNTILKAGPTVEVMGPRPSLRREFYNIEVINRTYVHEKLDATEFTSTRLAAQGLVRWLLTLPMTLDDELSFKLLPSGSHDPSMATMTIGDLLQNKPKIGMCAWGRVVNISEFVLLPGDSNQNDDESEEPSKFDTIIKRFPDLVKLFTQVRSRCDCPHCARDRPLGQGKIGCLREAASNMLVVLIADAIAEGFGGRDASGLTNTKLLRQSIHKLLSDLVDKEEVHWDTWFGVAAQVITGYDWENFDFKPAEGSTLAVAVQNGGMAVAATWLDLSTRINSEACFGLESMEGRLAGVIDESAIVLAERRMAAPRVTKPQPVSLDLQTTSHPDSYSAMIKMLNTNDILAKIETAIIGAGEESYRLLTMVRTGSSLRIMDPSGTVTALIRSSFPRCEPDCHLKINPEEETEPLLWAFDEALGFWDPTNMLPEDEGGAAIRQVWITQVGNERLSLNIAMGLSPHGCVVQGSSLCHHCAIAATSSQGRLPVARRILGSALQR